MLASLPGHETVVVHQVRRADGATYTYDIAYPGASSSGCSASWTPEDASHRVLGLRI
jgi:hypothetical protein